MSADDDGPGRREVARRVFAAEYDDADLSYSESDEERAPNYVVVPTGARVNRLFVVGVLTEVEAVNEDVLRARVVDPTGAFVVYAGQYQPDAVAALERTGPPAFVAVTGKARTFQPEDADRVYTSVRPESINEVDADTRDRWTVRTAEHTLARVAAFADALDRPERGDDLQTVLETEGVDPALAAGIPRAIDHYGTTRAYLAAVRDLAFDAARVVADELEEVAPLDLAPGEGGDADVSLEVPDTGGAVLAGAAAAGSLGSSSGTASTAATATETGVATETEPATEGTAAEQSASDEADTAEPSAATAGSDGAGSTALEEDATEEMYELDEEEREEIESEYGTEFASGDDIPEAGEADIEAPDPEDAETEAATSAATAEAESEPAPAADASAEDAAEAAEADGDAEAEGSESDAEAESETEPAAEGSGDEAPSGEELEDAVVEEMRALGDGDAVGRGELVGTVVEQYGVGESAVEDAIQDALMSGRCYESGDDELTPI